MVASLFSFFLPHEFQFTNFKRSCFSNCFQLEQKIACVYRKCYILPQENTRNRPVLIKLPQLRRQNSSKNLFLNIFTHTLRGNELWATSSSRKGIFINDAIFKKEQNKKTNKQIKMKKKEQYSVKICDNVHRLTTSYAFSRSIC